MYEPDAQDAAGATFGDLLRSLRRAAGLTQEELADRAGLSVRGIADLERGARRAPRRDTVALLVRALGAPPEQAAVLVAAARRPHATTEPPTTSPQPQRRHNLPAQATRLLGRDEAIRAVVALARLREVRMVTLTGPGGVGKTRLAIEVAAELIDDFDDGVFLVRLSRLVDPDLVIPTIAETLGVTESGGQPVAQTLRAYLASRHLLLVLDNFEHLAAAAPDVARLLEAGSALKVLATSRSPLRLRGEREYLVPPLQMPPVSVSVDFAHAPERLTDYPATTLFIDRARATQPDFAPTASNTPAIVGVCARLDGLPLAIELAATRVKVLPPEALLARLSTRMDVLNRGARDLEERQQTMRATIAWSEALLTPEERVLFRRLAVFVGGCTLEAAEAVCAAPEGVEPPPGLDVLDGLSILVEQSLVQQREDGGEARFGMLHVIREYALDRLEASGEREALLRAHAAYMLSLVEQAEPELTRPQARTWLVRLEREHDNLRAALRWAQERGEAEIGLRLVAAVFRFWMVAGYLQEGRAWAEEMLALNPAPDGVRARAFRAAGVLALYQGNESVADRWLEQATALARAAGDLRTVANALSSRGVAALNQGNLQQAGAFLQESLDLMRAVGERRDVASVLTNMGIVDYEQGDLERAAYSFSEALAIAREAGDRDLIATSLANLASVALRQGDAGAAEALGREALTLYHALADPRRCAVGLEELASSAGMAGRGRRAARLLGAAAAIRETLGAPQPPGERADVEQAVAPARVTLGEALWAAAFAEGRGLTLGQAVAEALGEAGGEDAGE